MAAIHCAEANAETFVFESNTVAGRKLLHSGAGRCNFTHLASAAELIRAFGPKGRFLSYSLHRFTAEQVRLFFRRHGLESSVEQDGCVFPVTQRASDVRDVLAKHAKSCSVHFYFGKPVKHIERKEDSFVIHAAGNIIYAKKVIIATGGLSWPQTGSTGDGYRLAKELGHHIIEPKASLVPLVTCQSWPAELSGTSLKDVRISAVVEGRKIAVSGPMIFTDDGIGGPAVLDLSSFLTDYLPNKENPIEIRIDMVRQISEAELDKQVRERIADNPKKTVAVVLADFVPRRAAAILCRQYDCQNLASCELTKELRRKLVQLVKAVPLSIVSTRPIDEAIVTRGGVALEEIDPKTMESKICPGLFFAGEVIDVDGPCGGYNLQLCWSTAALAGRSAAKNL
jgi:hypothetical protein